MRAVLFVVLCFAVSVSFGQKKGWPLEGSIQAGLLEGQSGSAFQMGFTGGVKGKTWTTSLGTGLDYYGVRSIPLFLQVQKKFSTREKTPFAFAGGGYHFPWLESNNEDWWGSRKASGGLYYSAGIGYQLPVMKTAALFFTAGYSLKEYEEDFLRSGYCIGGNCPTYTENYTYKLRRLSMTTGLRF
jgi:hypothetical protein